MRKPLLSIVIAAEDEPLRLARSVQSAVNAAAHVGTCEIVIAVGGSSQSVQEAAASLAGGAVRVSTTAASTTQSAAEIARGATVALLHGRDLLSPHYLRHAARALDDGDGRSVIVRPGAYMSYGGRPSITLQRSLDNSPLARSRLMFAAPFAPPVVAARETLLQLPARRWGVTADWRWTAVSLGRGVNHVVAAEAVYLHWTPPTASSVLLPDPPEGQERFPEDASNTGEEPQISATGMYPARAGLLSKLLQPASWRRAP